MKDLFKGILRGRSGEDCPGKPHCIINNLMVGMRGFEPLNIYAGPTFTTPTGKLRGRFFILCLLAALLVGCSSSSDNGVPCYDYGALVLQACEKAYKDSHAEWIAGETGGNLPEWIAGETVDYAVCEAVAIEVFNEIDYWHEKPDNFYWQPSLETEESGQGQCTDTAILIYIKLREAGIPDDHLKMIIFVNPQGDPYDDISDGHMACCIVDDRGYNYLSNSGFMGWNVTQEGMVACFMCDLWGLWAY